jgi:hypothetical protein
MIVAIIVAKLDWLISYLWEGLNQTTLPLCSANTLQYSMVLQLDPRFWQIGDGDGDDPPDSNRGWDPRPRPRTNGGWGPGMPVGIGPGVSAPCYARATSAVTSG